MYIVYISNNMHYVYQIHVNMVHMGVSMLFCALVLVVVSKHATICVFLIF